MRHNIYKISGQHNMGAENYHISRNWGYAATPEARIYIRRAQHDLRKTLIRRVFGFSFYVIVLHKHSLNRYVASIMLDQPSIT